jgi:hypothetical protein
LTSQRTAKYNTFFSRNKIFSLKSIGGTDVLFGNLATGHFSGDTGSSGTDFKVGVVLG